MFEISKLEDPRLARFNEGWIVEVPADKALESIDFAKSHGISGFKVNAFTGATQSTIDALLMATDPSVLVVAGNLEARVLGPTLKTLALGVGTPWPSLLAKSAVDVFTCMETTDTGLLPHKFGN